MRRRLSVGTGRPERNVYAHLPEPDSNRMHGGASVPRRSTQGASEVSEDVPSRRQCDGAAVRTRDLGHAGGGVQLPGPVHPENRRLLLRRVQRPVRGRHGGARHLPARLPQRAVHAARERLHDGGQQYHQRIPAVLYVLWQPAQLRQRRRLRGDDHQHQQHEDDDDAGREHDDRHLDHHEHHLTAAEPEATIEQLQVADRQDRLPRR